MCIKIFFLWQRFLGYTSIFVFTYRPRHRKLKEAVLSYDWKFVSTISFFVFSWDHWRAELAYVWINSGSIVNLLNFITITLEQMIKTGSSSADCCCRQEVPLQVSVQPNFHFMSYCDTKGNCCDLPHWLAWDAICKHPQLGLELILYCLFPSVYLPSLEL